MRKLTALLPAFMLAPVLLTSCHLMPEEDVLPTRPILYTYEAEEHKMESVVRGDLVVTAKINCKYVPAKEETLSFSIGSVYIDKVYVTEGQQVKAGQVLAELEQDNLQEQIASLEYQLQVLKLQKTHAEENRDLEIRAIDVVLKDLDAQLKAAETAEAEQLLLQKQQQEERRAEVKAEYAQSIQSVEDSIYLQQLRLEEMKLDLKQRQIVAGIDGTVTYIREVTDGMRSVKGQSFITVSDLDTTVFTVTGEQAQYFPVGTEVFLTCRNREFTACAVDPSEIGLAEDPDGIPTAYLKLKQPDPTLKDGDKGEILLTLEQRLDVLYLSTDAVNKANGETFVYMLDENGMRVMQKITTGLEVKGFVEITEGLKEGDRVVLD